MKKFLINFMYIAFILCLSACNSVTDNLSGMAFTEPADSVIQTKNEAIQNKGSADGETNMVSEKESEMKLFINDIEIPVIWEENVSVAKLMEDASKEDIIISMSMYSDFEQVGSLDREYYSDDIQMTAHNGDIVLYNSSNIVLFYGSNTWSYTKLGKMNLSQREVIDLLSNGNVTITISK